MKIWQYPLVIVFLVGAVLLGLPLLHADDSGEKIPVSKQDKTALKDKLTPLQFEVTQQCGTEPPFRNEYWNNHEAGIYVDVVSGEALFSSLDKFDSGTGWPSFTKPIDQSAVVEDKDVSHGMVRIEVKSKNASSHLGHVFDDGPGANGLRYCINSASLRFIPVAKLQESGYGQYLQIFSPKDKPTTTASNSQPLASESRSETAILAGGCFWGMEELLRTLPGITNIEVGYTGGNVPNPSYEMMKSTETGHAEAVKIEFEPTKLTYSDLLRYYFRLHNPTTKNRQGNDIGLAYRSAIFYTSDAQREAATAIKAEVDGSGKWKSPVVTEIVKASEWYRAEDYHQDYLQKHPNGYTCHFLRD